MCCFTGYWRNPDGGCHSDAVIDRRIDGVRNGRQHQQDESGGGERATDELDYDRIHIYGRSGCWCRPVYLNATVDGEQADPLPDYEPDVGSSWSYTVDSGFHTNGVLPGRNYMVVAATFDDGSAQVVLDTYV